MCERTDVCGEGEDRGVRCGWWKHIALDHEGLWGLVFLYLNLELQGFPGISAVKNLLINAGDVGLITRSGRSLEVEMATHSSILPEEFHGQRSLAGYILHGSQRVRHD